MILAKVLRIREPGGPETLTIGEAEIRDPGPGEVRVAVEAAGLNRADCLQRKGVYPAPPGVLPDVPGLEFAGEVESVGGGVTAFERGDRVMGICPGAGMATHLLTHERELLRVPKSMSLRDAAAVPEVFLTAYDAMMAQGGLGMGQTALIHAAASGVGTAAIQLALAAGATPIGTSRSAEKLSRCEELGLEHRVDTSEGSFADEVKALAPSGVDLILDTIGAKYIEENLRVLAIGGRVVTIGLLGGVKGTLPLGKLLSKRATWKGSILRSRPLEEKATLTQAFAKDVLPLFRSGRLRPVVEEALPMSRAKEAHERLEANTVFGKLVLHW